MRIAILLCGHFRTFDMKNLSSLYREGDVVDVFVHTYTKKYGYHPYIQETLGVSQSDNNAPITLLEIQSSIPDARKIVIEDEITEDDVSDLHMYPFALDIYSQIRKVRLCNKLRHEYESEHNISYDLVIRTRFDIAHSQETKLVYNNLEENAIYMPDAPSISYPQDVCYMGTPSSMDNLIKKLSRRHIGYRFIYPSFPNRGLLHLLEMFPRIVERYPQSHLDIFCDFSNEWLLRNHGTSTEKILVLLEQQKAHVTNHGWVSGDVLTKFWNNADIWFYPCVFEETCCLTAYEAAASNTLVVSNNLAALQESVGDRGIIVSGDPSTISVQNVFIQSLFDSLENKNTSDCIVRNQEWIKTKDFETVIPNFISNYL